MSTASSGEWEYKDVVIQFEQENQGQPLGQLGSNFTLSVARQEVWAMARPIVMSELKEWFDAGWEPLTTIGSDCLSITTSDRREFMGGGALFGVNTYFWCHSATVQMRRRRSSS